MARSEHDDLYRVVIWILAVVVGVKTMVWIGRRLCKKLILAFTSLRYFQ